MTKTLGKAAIWTLAYFHPLPPDVENVEKQWAKLASSYVMGLQQCVRGEGGFLNTLFKIPIIFCHWLFEIYQRKKLKEHSNNWLCDARPGIFWGRYHLEREKISLCSLVRYIIKGSKKQRWVVWGGGIAKISHKAERCLQQLKIFKGGKS